MNLLQRAVIWCTALVTGVALLLVFGLVEFYNHWPRTRIGWFLFVVGFPTVFIAVDFLGALLDREPVGRWVDDRTATKPFSWIRILYLTLRTMFLMVVIGAAVWLVGSRFPGVMNFAERHFGPTF
jgi:hypothetical protein